MQEATNPTTNYISEFNGLVRESAYWQEAFDNWDEGQTVVEGRWMRLSLDNVRGEWQRANAQLVRFVQRHGYDIMREDR